MLDEQLTRYFFSTLVNLLRERSDQFYGWQHRNKKRKREEEKKEKKLC